MQSAQGRFRSRKGRGLRLALLAGSALLLPLIGMAPAGARPLGTPPLGFRPLPPSLAAQFVRPVPQPLAFPPVLDWRDEGIITPAKNQGSVCGGCWAFAAAGLIEAMCILEGASPSLDMSEQYALSCDTDEVLGVWNDGCCGGYATVFEYFTLNPIVCEAEFPYGEGDFDGDNPRSCTVKPTWATIPCPASAPEDCDWLVNTWALLSLGVPTIPELKAALQQGPVWLGYYVYQDFMTYWATADPDEVYAHSGPGSPVGGHAVLCIGYSEPEQCWIVKNSWGLTGPNGDGTFRMAYNNNCQFGTNATWITVSRAPTPTRQMTLGGVKALFR